jgi:hypothetical protein
MMRFLAISLSLVLVVCIVSAQKPAGDKVSIDFVALRKTERDIDSRIERFDTNSPMYVIGATRASYIAGTGMVFSVEVSLAPAVGITPFFTKLKPEEVEKIYQAKKARVPMIQEMLLNALPDLAQAIPSLPAGEDVIVAATMFYFPYEKLDGMPRQIVVRGQAGALRKLRAPDGQAAAVSLSSVGKVFVY